MELDTTADDYSPRSETSRLSPYNVLERFQTCVDLLLACIYSPSLQKLADQAALLSARDLDLWLAFNSQNIRPLCELVLKGLEYDATAVIVLERLTCNVVLRDMFLQLKPQLLQGLIKASLANERAFEKYGSSIVSLLGQPLPEDFVVPVVMQSFIEATIQAITENTSRFVASLEKILRTNAAHGLSNLSTRQLEILEQTLRNCLGSGESTNFTALSCLASIAMHATSGGINSRCEQIHGSSIFHGHKSKRVVRLVMSTINSQLSSESSDMLRSPYNHHMILLENILKAIDKHNLTEWLAAKEGSTLVRKIIEKVELKICTTTVANVCILLSNLWGSTKADTSELKALATSVCERGLRHIVHGNNDPALTEAMCCMLPFSDTSVLYDTCIMTYILQMLVRGHHDTSHSSIWADRSQLHAIVFVVRELRLCFQHRPALLQDLGSGAGRNACSTFASFVPLQESSRLMCEVSIELNTAICCLIIELQSDNALQAELKQPCSVINALLRKLIHLSSSAGTSSVQAEPRGELVFFQETLATPQSGTGSQQWKARLLSELTRDAQHQHSSIVARMDSVCRDLECRAEINEQPIREAEAKLMEAQNLVSELQVKHAEASMELQQRDMENIHVFEERQRLEDVISNLLSENETSNCRISELEAAQDAAKHRCTSLVDAVEQGQVDLEKQYEILAKEKSTSQQACAELRAEIARLQSHISDGDQLLEEKIAANKDIEVRLGMMVTEKQTALDQVKTLTLQSAQQVAESKKAQNDLQARLAKETSSLSDAQENISALQQAMQVAMAREQELQVSLENIKALADEKLALQEEKHIAIVKSLQDQNILTQERSKAAMTHLERENASLREAMGKIKSSYERRCKEFEKAKELSERLIAVTTGAFSQGTPVAVRNPLLLDAAANSANNNYSKRHKGKLTSPSKRHSKSVFDGDETLDLPSADKENASPIHSHSVRNSFGREDAAILSELSGLGI